MTSKNIHPCPAMYLIKRSWRNDQKSGLPTCLAGIIKREMKCYSLATHGRLRMEHLWRHFRGCKFRALPTDFQVMPDGISDVWPLVGSLHWAKSLNGDIYGLVSVETLHLAEGQKTKKTILGFLEKPTSTDDRLNIELMVKIARQVAYDSKCGMVPYDDDWRRKGRTKQRRKAP